MVSQPLQVRVYCRGGGRGLSGFPRSAVHSADGQIERSNTRCFMPCCSTKSSSSTRRSVRSSSRTRTSNSRPKKPSGRTKKPSSRTRFSAAARLARGRARRTTITHTVFQPGVMSNAQSSVPDRVPRHARVDRGGHGAPRADRLRSSDGGPADAAHTRRPHTGPTSDLVQRRLPSRQHATGRAGRDASPWRSIASAKAATRCGTRRRT